MSCSDVQTIKAGDGSKLTFSFDFPYIFKSEIHVYFWNVTTKEWDEKLTTDSTYPWQITDANPTIVEFTSTAPPAPTAASVPNEETQDNVRIRRITKVDDIRALFNPGSAIRSDDLNKNFEQLRYAIQESGCQDVPEDLKEYLEEYYWDRYDNTLYDGDTWVSDDTKIASAEAIDDRIDSKINDAITTDIATDGTGITVTDDGDGTITLGLADIDLDRIKADDIITLAEQNAGPTTSNDSIFTSSAAAKRFDTLVQTDTPSATDYETGKTWLQNDDDLTLSVWNGSAWSAVTSGGTFINQPKVIYVDAGAGDDNNDGHRISRPKLTIRAALSDINADADGDGTIISVSPGIYAETLPLDIEKNDVAIIGQSLRTCIIHPLIPEADEGSYDVDTPHSQELQTMFRVNSGSYFQNLTFMGLKASGTRGASGSLYENTTYGLPTSQGWNFAFYPDATIRKSPYIQNCTNFSDSQINNVTFTPHTPGEGAAGDLDSAPTGGGILVDGSVPASDSPLRSMVCDSYTHTALDGPGILVTNNGYMQATSSYAFFNHAHITCINGGQANLAASTTDFGRFGLIADGKSPNPIFTSTVDGAASDGATTFNIDAPTAGSDLYGGSEAWFGDAERPATNMLVEVNSVIYPILSATANGSGWTVEISRPDSSDRSTNLGLDGAISDAATVNFYLRSMIASSGHTMEYVGSGTDYNALPENGGVPDENDQKIELNNGKIWTAITDHNGKFTIGGNQTDDPFFEVDQQLGFVTIPEGSIAFNLLSDETPQLGGNLDVNGNTITSTSNANVVIDPNGTGTVDVSTSRITSVTDPTGAQDAATKNYVDTNFNNYTHPNHTGDVTSTGDGATVIADDAVTSAKIADDAVGADQLADTAVTAGSYTSADITVDAQGRITAASSGTGGSSAINDLSDAVTNSSGATIGLGTGALANDDGTTNNNTAVGNDALNSNTSGTNNTAVGYQALDASTTATDCTAVGAQALGQNTGSNNAAFGKDTLQANTSGTGNAAFGTFALDASTTGDQNTACGGGALGSNTTANNNTAVGFQALFSNTTGTFNAALGHEAFYNNTGSNNTGLGYQAGRANTSGENNVYVGKWSGRSGTTGNRNVGVGSETFEASNTGDNNVAVGHQALTANTSGGNNTAVGTYALDANTTGANNVAVGQEALTSNTTAANNSAIGTDSLRSNTTGTENVAVGVNALHNNTTGNYNTAVGANSLDANTTQPENTAVGYNTLTALSGGNSCTAVGSQALEACTSGTDNSAFGHRALHVCTTGQQNVALGRLAMDSLTTGSYNTAVGSYALDACQTGSSNVAIGYQSLTDCTANNNVAIGHSAGANITTGGTNVAVGDSALKNGTGIIQCTAVGYGAGESNTAHEIVAVGLYALRNNTGGDNTGLGYQALDANTSGYNNVAVGFDAGGGNTTGVGNTFVGKNAGLNNTTGGQNICIGLGTGTLSGAGSNQIVLGYNIDSVGSNYFTFGKASNRVYNQFTSNASWTRSSDVRLKKDIQTNTDLGLGFINDLRTVTYKWKAPSELDSALPGYNADKTEAEYSNKMYGFIAQEVKQALDDHNVTDFAGWTTDNEGVQGISYEMFVMPLVKAVQELSAKNTALEARIAALEAA